MLSNSLQKNEEKILKFWKKNKIFEKSIKQRDEKKSFVFYDGPPFATGLPHYGHILASIIKDVVPRYWTMKGYQVKRRWGWDCHGLPVEEIAERELKISGKKQIEEIGIDKFNQFCRSKVLTYTKEWGKTIERIGRWVEFKNAYRTMDNSYIESVWWALKEVWKKELIYEDKKVLLYCPRCQTPISNSEVAMDNSYKDITEKTLIAKFKIKDQKNTCLLAWTTTPWTLIGNVALAINSQANYAKIKITNYELRITNYKEYFILAKERLSVIKEPYEIIEEFKGKDLIDLEYEKLYDLKSEKKGWYVIDGKEEVTIEEGVGIVHLALYGELDYEMIKKYNLPEIQHINFEGKLIDGPREWIDSYFKNLDKKVLEDLKKRNLLFSVEDHVHSCPFCWRCGTFLFYNAIRAWFINIQEIKPRLLELNEKNNWYPKHLKHGRFKNNIESAPDWNISRNRYWATPLPIWICEKCGEKKCLGSFKELEKSRIKETIDLKNNYILLRHVDAENVNKINSCYPEKKISRLTEKGKKDLEELAKKINVIFPESRRNEKNDPVLYNEVDSVRKNGINLIFSSDLFRTREVAERIARELNLKVNYKKVLRETNYGIFNGKTVEECDLFYKERKEKFFKKPAGAESWNDVKKRVFTFLKECEKKYSGKTILFVSHGDPMWLLEAKIRKFSNEQILKNPYFQPGEMRKFSVEVGSASKKLFRTRDPATAGQATSYKLQDLHRPWIDEVKLECPKCKNQMSRIPEVLDCWFESASMPFASQHYPFENKDWFKKNFPADFVVEYIAQTRAWFYYMHTLSTILFDRHPFKNIVTTGTIMAEDGTKMSKSKGNFPNPWLLFEKYGVDALRYYLITSPVMLAENIDFFEKRVDEIYKKLILILKNTFSFFTLYVKPNSCQLSVTSCQLSIDNVLDQWILAKLNLFNKEIVEYMDNYEIAKAGRLILDFVNDLSTWYLRRSRNRIKENDQQAVNTFYYVLLFLSKIIAPFIPFIAEEIYQILKSYKLSTTNYQLEESVHLCDYPQADEKLIDNELLEKMELVKKICEIGHCLRKKAGIKIRQPLSNFQFSIFNFQFKNDLLDLIKDELNVKKVEIVKEIKEEKDWLIQEEKNLKVALNTFLTDELIEEGRAREIVRLIQDLRKEIKCKVDDRIKIFYQTSNSQEKKFFEKFEEYFKKETLANVILEKELSKKNVILSELRKGKEIEFEGIKMRVVKNLHVRV